MFYFFHRYFLLIFLIIVINVIIIASANTNNDNNNNNKASTNNGKTVPPPAAGMYSLSQMQDYLIYIDGNGTNKTIGKVDLGQQFNPIGPQMSTIWKDTATMYVLALNKTDGIETSIIGISLADASITGVFRTPLLQTSVEIGAGMTIDAYGKHGLVISGIDTATKKHTAYLIDPNKVNIISL